MVPRDPGPTQVRAGIEGPLNDRLIPRPKGSIVGAEVDPESLLRNVRRREKRSINERTSQARGIKIRKKDEAFLLARRYD